MQAQIQQMKRGAGADGHIPNAADDKKKAAADAISSVLFQEAVTKKDIARKALEKAAALEKKKEKEKEPDKRDIYVDTRDQKQADDMANWDDAKLKEVVGKKAGGQGQRVATDIICKHFLDAVEKRTYGWFWECPNGGDKCQYRHALPEGYVLSRDKVDEVVDTGPTLEEEIEARRKALTKRTPVTFDRLQEWLRLKKEAAAAKEAEEMDGLRKAYEKTGKLKGVTGRQLFVLDASLFVDDAAANDVAYEREESGDEGEEGAEEGGGGGGGGGGHRGGYTPIEVGSIPAPPPPEPSGGSGGESGESGEGGAGGDGGGSSGNGGAASCSADAGAAGGGSSASGGADATLYEANYEIGAPPPPGAGLPAAPAQAPPEALVADLEGVDESLFLDDDLLDEEDIE